MIVDLSTHAAAGRVGVPGAGASPGRRMVILATAAQLDALGCRGADRRGADRGEARAARRLAAALRAAAGERAAAADAARRTAGPAESAPMCCWSRMKPVNAAVAQGYLAELGCTWVWVDNGSEGRRAQRDRAVRHDHDGPQHARHGRFRGRRLIREREGAGSRSTHRRAHGS